MLGSLGGGAGGLGRSGRANICRARLGSGFLRMAEYGGRRRAGWKFERTFHATGSQAEISKDNKQGSDDSGHGDR